MIHLGSRRLKSSLQAIDASTMIRLHRCCKDGFLHRSLPSTFSSSFFSSGGGGEKNDGIDDDGLPYHVVMRMPSLSKSYNTFSSSGIITKWNFGEGQEFEAGTSLGVVETTDQGTFNLDTYEDGVVAKHLVKAGSEQPVKVGDPIMVFVDDIEDVDAFQDFVPPPPAQPPL